MRVSLAAYNGSEARGKGYEQVLLSLRHACAYVLRKLPGMADARVNLIQNGGNIMTVHAGFPALILIEPTCVQHGGSSWVHYSTVAPTQLSDTLGRGAPYEDFRIVWPSPAEHPLPRTTHKRHLSLHD